MLFDIAIESLPRIVSYQRAQAAKQATRDDLRRYIAAQEHVIARLNETTFYELARSACSLIYEANLNPVAVASALPDLRFPAQRSWIEFDSEMRYSACAQSGQVPPEREGVQPSRMAFFVDCDDDACRKGAIYRFINFKQTLNGDEGAWSRMGLNSVEDLVRLDRVAFRFDLDDKREAYTAEQIARFREEIARSSAEILERRTRQGVATPLDKLLDQNDETIAQCMHMSQCFEPHSFGEKGADLMDQLGNWVGEQAFLTSFLALLITDVVETEKSDLAKINRTRTKKGKPELRDYITIRLKRGTTVYKTETEGGERQGSGMHRRFHLVAGHFRHQPTNNGPKLIWIAPHSRGKQGAGQRYKVV
jgi:hypothetical protein